MRNLLSNRTISFYLIIVAFFVPFYTQAQENSHLLISPKGVVTIHIDQINPQEEYSIN